MKTKLLNIQLSFRVMLKSLFLIHHKDVVKEDERERRKENERNPKRIGRDEEEKENDENFKMVEKVISHVIRVILLKNNAFYSIFIE